MTDKKDSEKSVDEILVERGSRYGDYKKAAKVRAKIMNILIQHNKDQDVEPFTEEIIVGISDIVSKLVRASISPTYFDNYNDIAGYSTIMKRKFCDEV